MKELTNTLNYAATHVGNGIGHDIELVIDNDFSNSIILNDYYEADLDTYKSGEINFELSDLSTGEHTIKIKVWDKTVLFSL